MTGWALLSSHWCGVLLNVVLSWDGGLAEGSTMIRDMCCQEDSIRIAVMWLLVLYGIISLRQSVMGWCLEYRGTCVVGPGWVSREYHSTEGKGCCTMWWTFTWRWEYKSMYLFFDHECERYHDSWGRSVCLVEGYCGICLWSVNCWQEGFLYWWMSSSLLHW